MQCFFIKQKKLHHFCNLPALALGVTAFSQDVADQTSSNAMVFATLSIPFSDWRGGSQKKILNTSKKTGRKNKHVPTAYLLTMPIKQLQQQPDGSNQATQLAKEAELKARKHLKVISDKSKAAVATTSNLLEAEAMLLQSLDILTNARSL
jgi:hypothetical protein